MFNLHKNWLLYWNHHHNRKHLQSNKQTNCNSKKFNSSNSVLFSLLTPWHDPCMTLRQLRHKYDVMTYIWRHRWRHFSKYVWLSPSRPWSRRLWWWVYPAHDSYCCRHFFCLRLCYWDLSSYADLSFCYWCLWSYYACLDLSSYYACLDLDCSDLSSYDGLGACRLYAGWGFCLCLPGSTSCRCLHVCSNSLSCHCTWRNWGKQNCQLQNVY